MILLQTKALICHAQMTKSLLCPRDVEGICICLFVYFGIKSLNIKVTVFQICFVIAKAELLLCSLFMYLHQWFSNGSLWTTGVFWTTASWSTELLLSER